MPKSRFRLSLEYIFAQNEDCASLTHLKQIKEGFLNGQYEKEEK